MTLAGECPPSTPPAKLRFRLLAAAILSLCASSSWAADPALEKQLDALEKSLQSLQSQVDQQKQQLEQQSAELEALRVKAAVPAPVPVNLELQKQVDTLQQTVAQSKLVTQEQPRLSFAGNRPTITSSDGRSSLSLRSSVQFDMGAYRQDDEGPLATDYRRGSVGAITNRENNAARDLSNGAYFRRARFGVEGVIARDFNYRLLLELAGSATEGPARINDAWISYSGFAPLTFALGAFSPPANLDDSTTPEDQLFIERATIAELSRTLGGADGRLGIGVRAAGTRWMSALTLTGRTVNDAEVFDAQSALVGRAGFLALTAPDYNVHLGLNGTYVLHAADQGSGTTVGRYGIRLRDRPEIRIDGTRLIDTGPIDADSGFAAGLEFAANWRGLFVQAENFWMGVDRRNTPTLADPRFTGYYVQGSWVLTGESRRYNALTASFQNPRPFVPFTSGGGKGAWELALRYSHTDLNDNEGLADMAAPADGIRGGEQNIWTFGLNWYVNPNLKFLLNYLRIDVDRLNPAGPGNLTPFGAAPGTPPLGAQIGQDLSVIALRTQYGF